jgi:predicted dehydrogenase
MDRKLKFALFGAGFWSRFQLAGWYEIGGVECVAIYNRTREKANRLAAEFNVARVYDDPAALLKAESLDFVDICTSADTHRTLTLAAAERGLPIICQKPMAESFTDATEMVNACRRAGVPLLINENWRWQTPIRTVKDLLDEGQIGRPFRARIRMTSGFPVFANQPFLRELEQFLLVDIGTHILDVARFLLGEAESVYCQTARVQQDIRGEDLATVLLRMVSGATVTCELGYPGSPHENDSFPQTYAFIEGEQGSISLTRDYVIRVVDGNGTHEYRATPKHYPWADPAYDVVHSSIVPCQRNLLGGLSGDESAETTGEDNLRTLRLVYAAYESAAANQVVQVQDTSAYFS